jgi:hypothetical protein
VRQRDHSFATHLGLNIAKVAHQAIHCARRATFPQCNDGSETGFRGGMT